MQIQFGKLLLLYLVFMKIPYLIVKCVEKILLHCLDLEIKTKLNEELKIFPQNNELLVFKRNKMYKKFF